MFFSNQLLTLSLFDATISSRKLDSILPFLFCSEQPGSVQILLTDNQEEVWEVNQDASLGPPPPAQMNPLTSNSLSALKRPSLNTPHTPIPQPWPEDPTQGSDQSLKATEYDGVKLSDVLQASGGQIRPIHKHLAISLPSLPLKFWGVLDEDEELSQHQPPLASSTTSPASSLWRGTSDTPHPNVANTLPQPEKSVQEHPRAPIWQPLRNPPFLPSPVLSRSSPRHAPPPVTARHWSSWSLDRPDAVVTPHETPPDQSHLIRPTVSPRSHGWNGPPHSPMSSRNKNIKKFASSQFEPKLEAEAAENEEKELSELDSLYQASLRAGRRQSPATGKPGGMSIICSSYCENTIKVQIPVLSFAHIYSVNMGCCVCLSLKSFPHRVAH